MQIGELLREAVDDDFLGLGSHLLAIVPRGREEAQAQLTLGGADVFLVLGGRTRLLLSHELCLPATPQFWSFQVRCLEMEILVEVLAHSLLEAV